MTITLHFDEELDALKRRLLDMGAKAQMMIEESIQALMERNLSVILNLPELEKEVNSLQLEIDDRCFKLLALRQPMAHDLRLIIAAMKISSDLERIGDQSINIVQSTKELMDFPDVDPLTEIVRMSLIAKGMLQDSLDAFFENDASKAREVVVRDDAVDELKDHVFNELVSLMISDPRAIQVGLQLILVARHLERIADHATNIAEDVVYLVEAKDIRHPAENPEGPITGETHES